MIIMQFTPMIFIIFIIVFPQVHSAIVKHFGFINELSEYNQTFLQYSSSPPIHLPLLWFYITRITKLMSFP